MDGVGISIIGRPRPLPGHDTPNPANNTYSLKYEEPENVTTAVLVHICEAIGCGLCDVADLERRPNQDNISQ